MGIPIGKLACTRPAPESRPSTAPGYSRCGSNNSALLEDPLYLGLRRIGCAARIHGVHRRVRGAVQTAIEVLHSVGGLRQHQRGAILERYRDRICTYNDDIQGTAAVALAGVFGALRISGQKLTEQRFLFLAVARRNRNCRAHQRSDDARGLSIAALGLVTRCSTSTVSW